MQRTLALPLFALAAIWAAYRVVDLVCDVLEKKAKATATKIDDLLLPLLQGQLLPLPQPPPRLLPSGLGGLLLGGRLMRRVGQKRRIAPSKERNRCCFLAFGALLLGFFPLSPFAALARCALPSAVV